MTREEYEALDPSNRSAVNAHRPVGAAEGDYGWLEQIVSYALWYPGDVLFREEGGDLRRATPADDPEALLMVMPDRTLQGFQEAMNSRHTFGTADADQNPLRIIRREELPPA